LLCRIKAETRTLNIEKALSRGAWGLGREPRAGRTGKSGEMLSQSSTLLSCPENVIETRKLSVIIRLRVAVAPYVRRGTMRRILRLWRLRLCAQCPILEYQPSTPANSSDFTMENATNSQKLIGCWAVRPPYPGRAMVDPRLQLGNKRFVSREMAWGEEANF
jgi:hypothetical protein